MSPDPDGAGTLKHRAQRFTYAPHGALQKAESGTVNSQSDADWTAFAPLEAVETSFDTHFRPATSKLTSGATTYALTQTSYDALSRPECTAIRMNPAVYGTLPASACTLGTAGTNGPDRISKTVYDFAGQVTQQQVAVGTTVAATERTLTYTNNGALQTLKDAENNLTTYEYDGFDRLLKTRFPLPTKGANASSTTDYEQLSYDANGNVTSRRLRDATSIAITFDTLNRPTLKNLPGSEPDVTFGYDNLGRLTSASQTGSSLSFTYDALGRNLTQIGPQGTVTSTWDLAGRRTSLAYPDGALTLNYDYLVTGDMTAIRENGAASGIGVLAAFAYNALGNRTSATFGNGTSTSYAFDPVSRLSSLTQNLSGTTNDLTIGSMSYNPANQIVSQNRSNDLYAWTGHGNGSTAGVANGLNQLTSIGGVSATHDTKGNVTSDPANGKSYTYSSENLLKTATGGVTLSYDPMMRLSQLTGTTTTNFAYDGLEMIAEYDGASALQRRFVFGPGVDEPLVQYEGSGLTDKRWLHADERGSIVATSDSTGALLGINKYDEFGKPQATNIGRFQYTGQIWLPEIGLQYSKARMYDPALGRFLQADPIGYADNANLYAYVGNDPINVLDPLGLDGCPPGTTVCGQRPDGFGGAGSSGSGPTSGANTGNVMSDDPIVIKYWRKQKAAGNPIAGWGVNLGLDRTAPWYSGEGFSRRNLLAAILHTPIKTKNGSRYPTLKEAYQIYQRIRAALIAADIAARANDTAGTPGLLSARQIFEYHVQVFESFGLPSTAFAGSFVFGTAQVAIATGNLPFGFGWCAGCDTVP